jgi:poly(3-hydroxybutyrate) depolymerase
MFTKFAIAKQQILSNYEVTASATATGDDSDSTAQLAKELAKSSVEFTSDIILQTIEILKSEYYLEKKRQYKTIIINGVTRYYTTFNIEKSSRGNGPVLLCFHGGGGTIDEFIEYTQFNLIAESIIVFKGQKSLNTSTWTNAFPWLYKEGYKDGTQDDVNFVDEVLSTIYGSRIPQIFLTGKSNGAGFCAYYSNLSMYKNYIKAIGICASSHFGLDSVTNIGEFNVDNCYKLYNDIIIPYNIFSPLKNISVFIIHGTGDTTIPYDGAMYNNENAYEGRDKTIWTEIDKDINKIDGVIETNTYTANIPKYIEFIQTNNTLQETYNSSNVEYEWNSASNDKVVLNSISIIGQKHCWSGHANSGSGSDQPTNFYLDATYLLIKFFKFNMGSYITSIPIIPDGLRTYDNNPIITDVSKNGLK